MGLIMTPLKKAYMSLIKGVARANEHPHDLEVRDGCIQRFEYTYDLSIKFMKRYLEQESSVTEKIDQLNFRDLLRIAGEVGLIQQVTLWFAFREARNNTSHTYNEDKAQEVFQTIPAFLKEAEFLIAELEKRSAPP
jgi:nucleotidyltransferase substrate binding protein (TIGR01987 family)